MQAVESNRKTFLFPINFCSRDCGRNSIRFLTVPSFKSLVIPADLDPALYHRQLFLSQSMLIKHQINSSLPKLIVEENARNALFFLMEPRAWCSDLWISFPLAFFLRGRIRCSSFAFKRFVDFFLAT